MELDYFTLYLRRYLRDHRFETEEINSVIVSDNAEAALQTYIDQRVAGNNDVGATEVALKDLFSGIGLSREEVAADIMEMHFNGRINNDEPEVINFWIRLLVDDDSIWQSYHLEEELGLSERLVEEDKGRLVNRINQFLTNHGL